MSPRSVLWSLLCCVPMVFASCHHPVPTTQAPSADPELASVDSLMWQQPDSALTRLIPYFDTEAGTAFDRHYAHLLLSELLYKNDYEQTNRGALLHAVDYFDSICGRDALNASPANTFLDARAHYIKGVGYYERDSLVEACQEYLKAVEIMESRFPTVETPYFNSPQQIPHCLQFIPFIYTRLTDLYSDLYLHIQAIFFAQKTLPYYKQQNPLYYSWALNQIGTHYELIDALDSAAYYYQKAIVFSDSSTLLFRDIVSHLALLEYKKDSLKADSVIKQLTLLLQNSENSLEIDAQHLCIGEIFFCEHEYDSALFYYSSVNERTSNLEIKKQTAERLMDIYSIKGDTSKTLEYACFLAPYATHEENKSEIKTQLTELYNTFKLTETQKQHQKATRLATRINIVTIGFLLLVISIVFFLYYHIKKRKQYLEKQIESERDTYKQQIKALFGRLKHNQAKLKNEKNSKSLSLPRLTERQKSAACYSDEIICQHIISVCNDKKNPIKSIVPVSAYKNIALNDAQKYQLKMAAMRHYGPLFDWLMKEYPELKDKDYLYCYLCLLGLENNQIAVLMQNVPSTIWDREKRLKRIFGSQDKVSVILYGFLNDLLSSN